MASVPFEYGLVVAAVLFVLGLVYAQARRASVASCWDPTLGWRCSQTAGTTAQSLADAGTVVAFGGLALAIIAGIALLSVIASLRYDGLVVGGGDPWTPGAADSPYPWPRCGQRLWSMRDARWSCPSCGALF